MIVSDEIQIHKYVAVDHEHRLFYYCVCLQEFEQ